MTLGELESFFTGAWPLLEVLEANFADDGYDVERMHDFVVAIESEFYPELERLYRDRITAWAADRRASEAEDDDDGAAC